MAKKSDFRTVDTDLEELDEKIRQHRRRIALSVLGIVAAIILLVVFVCLWMAIRTYDEYEISYSTDYNGGITDKFLEFSGNIIAYSNDGITCMDSQNNLLWNQSFEMISPAVSICRDYLVVYDKTGTGIYIVSMEGLQQKIETSVPIQKVCIAGQGTIAVLMKDDEVSYVKMYDAEGNELASGQFYGDQGGYPVDIALSYDAKKMAVDMLDVNNGTVTFTISFYNFGRVGQNEIDNNVATFSYTDVFIPEIEYVSEDRMIAVCDNKFLIFEGSEKPQLKKEIPLEQEAASVFHNEKYIGIAYENQEEAGTFHIVIYDMKGGKVTENDTDIRYDYIGFLANNEICVRNETQCELFTIHGIKKFEYTFDESLRYVQSQGGIQNYVFLFQEMMEEVRLK